MDEVSNNSYKYVVERKYSSLDKEWTITRIDEMAQTYDNLLLKINKKYLR